MAGDIGVGEVLILGEAPEDAQLPPIVHDYGPKLKIGLTGNGNDAEPIRFGSVLPDDLSTTERRGHDAFLARQSVEYIAEKRNRAYEGESWERDPPGSADEFYDDDPGTTDSDSDAPGTSERLTGRLALGMIFVSGPTLGLELTVAEQDRFEREAQNGLSWMAGQSPAKDVTWVHERIHVHVDVPDTLTPGLKRSAYEEPWRNAAQKTLGLRPDMEGVIDYVRELRKRHGTDWGYCVFFTKYNLYNFAYAKIGGPRVVMNCQSSLWVKTDIDRLFAHETGHIFGAPDEYARSKYLPAPYGHFGVPNLNHRRVVGKKWRKCIMDRNAWAMCPCTPYHLGYNGLKSFVAY